MLNFCRLILVTTLMAPVSASLANSAGLILNSDSVEVYYNDAASDKVLKNTRKQYTFMYSQESAPRNLMLSVDAELLKYSKPLKKSYLWGPKVGMYLADFNDNNLLALAGGVYLRRPASAAQKYDFLTEILYAPQLTSFIKADYLWSIKFQWNYPLPDEAELNVGFRTIQIKMDQQQRDSFDTGLYLGLSKRF